MTWNCLSICQLGIVLVILLNIHTIHTHSVQSRTGIQTANTLLSHRHNHDVDSRLMQPNFNVMYHTADELYELINEIGGRNAINIRVTTPFKHHSDWSTHPYVNELQLVEISNFDSSIPDCNKLHIQLTFGEHGREIISSEVALKLIQLFDIDSSEYLDSSILLSDQFRSYILDNVHIYLVPLLNVWGHKQIELGYTCERKNMNGVDPNRNYGYDFKRTDEHDQLIAAGSETYPGKYAFSELESQYVKHIGELIIDRHGVHDLYINVHSGVREMYRGWDSNPSPIPNHIQVDQLLSFINTHHCNCKSGGAGEIGGYVVYGGSMDYFYTHFNVSHSLTFEIYGDESYLSRELFDCYPFFNPITAHQLHNQTTIWSYSFLSASLYLLKQKHQQIYPYTLPGYLHDAQQILQPTHNNIKHYMTNNMSLQHIAACILGIVISIICLYVLLRSYNKYRSSNEYQSIPHRA